MKHANFRSYLWDLTKLIISAFLGFLFAYITFSKGFDANEKGRLNDNLNKLLEVNLQYPFVEDSIFIAKWNVNEDIGNDSALRYETYCEYLFNFAQNLCEYFKYDKRKIEDFMNIDDLIAQHKGWWKRSDEKNYASFPKRFGDFITQVFAETK
jgi:hypothetical protein